MQHIPPSLRSSSSLPARRKHYVCRNIFVCESDSLSLGDVIIITLFEGQLGHTNVIVSRHRPHLFQPTASAFIIALKHQPHLSFASYLGSSMKPHPQNAILYNEWIITPRPHRNIKTGGREINNVVWLALSLHLFQVSMHIYRPLQSR